MPGYFGVSIIRRTLTWTTGRRPRTVTAFGLVMLGKLVFLVFVLFFAVVVSLRLNPAYSLSF